MAKLIPLEEAAEMLGVTPEKLTEMRSNNEVFGYRDGATWKFKQTEIDRVASQLGVDVNDAIGESGVDLPLPAFGAATRESTLMPNWMTWSMSMARTPTVPIQCW